MLIPPHSSLIPHPSSLISHLSSLIVVLISDVLVGFVAVVDEIVITCCKALNVSCLMLAVASIKDNVDSVKLRVKSFCPPHCAVACCSRLGHQGPWPVSVKHVVVPVDIGPRVKVRRSVALHVDDNAGLGLVGA